MKDQNIIVWFSCGAASAVASYLTVKKYGATNNVRIVNNPIKEEHSDNLRFLKDVEKWIGVDIEYATHKDYPSASAHDVWSKVKGMSFPHGAPCTRILKKEARYQFEDNNDIDFHVLGFTVDEKKRHERFVTGERDNVIPVLIDEGFTKDDCYRFLKLANIQPPKIYELGYPNANCIGCVKATSPTYWNHVRDTFPDVFKERAVLSRKLGARLVRVKGERKFLDELKTTDKGRPMKTIDFECGLFCEETQ